MTNYILHEPFLVSPFKHYNILEPRLSLVQNFFDLQRKCLSRPLVIDFRKPSILDFVHLDNVCSEIKMNECLIL